MEKLAINNHKKEGLCYGNYTFKAIYGNKKKRVLANHGRIYFDTDACLRKVKIFISTISRHLLMGLPLKSTIEVSKQKGSQRKNLQKNMYISYLEKQSFAKMALIIVS